MFIFHDEVRILYCLKQAIKDPFMKLYYYSLCFILPKFTKFNTYFQSEHVVISNLNHEIITLYEEILMCYKERNYVLKTKVELIDTGNETSILNIQICISAYMSLIFFRTKQ